MSPPEVSPGPPPSPPVEPGARAADQPSASGRRPDQGEGPGPAPADAGRTSPRRRPRTCRNQPPGKKWYYQDQGRPSGPVDEPEMQQWLRDGKLKADDLVWTEGLSAWTPVRNAGLVTPPPPPAPEPPTLPISAPPPPPLRGPRYRDSSAPLRDRPAALGEVLPRVRYARVEGPAVSRPGSC